MLHVRVRVPRTVHTYSGRNCNIPPNKPRTEHRNKFCYDVLLQV